MMSQPEGAASGDAPILLAVALAVGAALALGVGAVWQHRAVTRHPGQGPLSWRSAGRLVRTRRWVAGTALIAAAPVLHLAAVAIAPLSLVQPLGILAVPVDAVARRRTRADAAGRPLPLRSAPWREALVVVAGATVLAGAVADHTARAAPTLDPSSDDTTLVAALLALGPLCVAATLAAGRSPHWSVRAAGAAVAYGLATALLRLGAIRYDSEHALTGAILAALGAAVAVMGLGAWLVHDAFRQAQPEVVAAVVAFGDPATALAYGVLALDEWADMPTLDAFSAGAGAAVTVLGVVLLARRVHGPEPTADNPAAQNSYATQENP